MGHPVDVHVGSRIRQRRFMLGLTQQALAESLGITFQQVQKYEIGANRVSASRLWEIARLLGVPVAFFFQGLAPSGAAVAGDVPARPEEQGSAGPVAGGAGVRAAAGAMSELSGMADLPLDRDAATLLRSFCAIPAPQRQRLLDLARSLSDPAA